MAKKTSRITLYKKIWGNIRKYQYLHDLTDEELARILELTTRTLYTYDKDPSGLTLKRVQSFIDYSGMELDALTSA